MATRSRSPQRRPRAAPSGPSDPSTGPSSPRELIVVTRPDAELRSGAAGVSSAAGFDVTSLDQLLRDEGVVMTPLFGPEERVRAEVAASMSPGVAEGPPLWAFYAVDAPDDRLDALASRLNAQEIVDGAYVKPPSEPPVIVDEQAAALNDMTPLAGDAPPATPDFTNRQGYLDAAPGGIDARYAWTLSGGGGAGVRIIDCEWGWRFTHEDLRQNQGGVVAGTGSTDTNHGTAVLGEISGDRNTLGVTGIAPDAVISASAFSVASATAIRSAADRLGPGDIILLEIHRGGPNTPSPPQGQMGYIAIEWWPDDFAAIRYAVNKGIIVVEAAGNGFQNLDDAIYGVRPAGFPTSWTNPFNPNNPSSGAVVVGAGAPPSGNWGTDRSRLDYSNYGARVDAQGWGREVVTTGYGNLQGGTDSDLWYTDTFSGTSSASPIVVGAIACVQGVLRARGRIPLSPSRARELLRASGSPQQDTAGRPASQRIGNRPNLRSLIAAATPQVTPWTGVQFRGSVAARQTQCWFTFRWPAHWHVVWTVVPTTPVPGAPQISWRVRIERASDTYATYWICITNLTGAAVEIEARYAVLGW
ncbi:MAG: S8 family peptidase [Acidimicrobiia bacterium]